MYLRISIIATIIFAVVMAVIQIIRIRNGAYRSMQTGVADTKGVLLATFDTLLVSVTAGFLWPLSTIAAIVFAVITSGVRKSDP